MKTWIVWIYPACGVRYIDSMWADEQHAVDRLQEVKSSWKSAGNPETGNRHQIWCQEAEIADAALAEVKEIK